MVSILGANSVSGDYEVSNSLRFDDGSSAYLSRTQTAGNRRTWTWSGWIKRGIVDTRQNILSAGIDGNDESQLRFDATGYLRFKESTGNSPELLLDTNALFRDPAAWYHIVVAVDTTQSTDSDRVKIYVNGSQVTSFNSPNYPSQNYDTRFNNNSQATYLGLNVPAHTDYYDGYMTEVNFVDGSQKAPTDFGEFNDNGVWIPKKYSGSYGTNGYFLQFKQTGTSQNASGIGADTSGQGNHFAVTNLAATDVTEDTCTNNFATMNPLDNYYAGATFSEGNCKIVTGSSPTTFVTSTLGVETGKWYWEVKIIDKAGGSDDTSIGVQGGVSPGATDQMGYNTAGVQLRSNGNKHTNGSNATYMASQDNNDIIMVAFDKTNNNVYFGANGQWGDGSGNTDESNPTSAISITITAGDFVFAALGDMDGSDTCTYEINFGNPSFAISSGNADANGYGNFEYAPPSGYHALNTKNLAEFG